MLSFLRISGLALIDELELSLGPGFTVITGETGTGKSILVDALSLLRGGRARTELVRAGSAEAQVEAVFSLRPDDPRLEALAAQGRQVEDGLLVRRMVPKTGKGRVYLGGGLATVGELSDVVGSLVDITSQHDQQSLMDPESQLAIVDSYANNGDALEEMRAEYASLAKAENETASFEADARTRAEREDFLRFQVHELEEANLVVGEDEALRLEREKVKGAEKYLAAATRGEEILDSAEVAAASLIGSVVRELQSLCRLDADFAAYGERLSEAQSIVQDVARDLGRYASSVRFDPQRLEEIEERLYLIGRLARKHGGTLQGAVAAREQLTQALNELSAYEDSLAERREAVTAARQRATALAQQLTARRQRAARSLGKAIDSTLADLGLTGACVTVEVEDRGPQGLGPAGQDRVAFQFAPNAGEPPRPLAKIASGGELSRVMLAVKQALARADQTSTYVFDEVDSGVGGAVAEVIGLKIRSIAAQRQVFAVTHLAQIAAFADRHLKVEKQLHEGRTVARVRVLSELEREDEMARMLGGLEPTPEAAEHARQMLRGARGEKLRGRRRA